jgi:hypothetical protein
MPDSTKAGPLKTPGLFAKKGIHAAKLLISVCLYQRTNLNQDDFAT